MNTPKRYNFDSVIFDLDGTLWNACETSAVAWTKGAGAAGIGGRVISYADIASVCGLPLPACVDRLFPTADSALKEGLRIVLDEHERTEIEGVGGVIYPGVSESIPALSRCYRLYIVSNCQEWYLESFFKHSGLKSQFTDWECYGRSQRSKAENLGALITRNQAKSPIYVGDTAGDLDAAAVAECEFALPPMGLES